MLHFVLEDIEPTKAKSFENFLAEMNDIAVLASMANAPFIAADLLEEPEPGVFGFTRSENDFEASFKGKMENNQAVNGYFTLREDGRRIIEVSYSIADGKPIDLRAKFNCEGESMMRSELERAFERDFSFEAHEYMKQPLEEEKPVIEEEVDEVELKEDHLEGTKPEQHEEPVDEQELEDEVSEEIKHLSQKVLDAMDEVDEIIHKLNDLFHDITRGATGNFGNKQLNEETLENGAIVQMIDDETNGYKVTFRKGVLGNMSEVSFFLEQGDELIFSIYLSSAGNGQITAQGTKGERTIKRVKDRLF